VSEAAGPDAKTTEALERVLEELVRPLLARDGGGIELVSVSGADVVVRLCAGCAGCPGAKYTTDAVLVPLMQTVVSDLSLKVERAP
jgi:Fe-S cluster biogenesis protein NfuA